MSFQATKTIDDLLKQAELELLLSRVEISADSGTTLYPVTCPAVGRSDDYQQSTEGEPVCVSNNGNCHYFGKALFDLDGYVKQIICKFEKSKG